MSLSINQLKYIQSLHSKKNRENYQEFILEGNKICFELLNQDKIIISCIYALEHWIGEHISLIQKKNVDFQIINDRELDRISLLKNPQKVVAVAKIPDYSDVKSSTPSQGLMLYLDNIQDPGNLGTIVRTADWFGIERIFLSPDCVEVYNPKVVQATMGSLFRVNMQVIELDELKKQHSNIPIVGAMTNGESYLEATITKPCILVVGNEGNGIRSDYERLLDSAIAIPSHGNAESLNVAVATGILISRFI